MERAILHVDCNSFYASVECLYHPEIRDKPVVVGGSEALRHGIVLTGNAIAKKRFGIRSGMSLMEARRLCPSLVVCPPHYPLYLRFAKLTREIYADYTDRIESFGLDECWLDVTGCGRSGGDPAAIADRIRARILFELGITVSVGVSYNKIFAKLGSDYKKPNAVTVISKDNFRQIVWPLPVSDLLMVGAATERKLIERGYRTIGALAAADPKRLALCFGKNGYMLHAFANGWDDTPVTPSGFAAAVKSVGNGITTPRDLSCTEDAKMVLFVLAESVARRLREQGLKAQVVSVGIRDRELRSFVRQRKLTAATNDTARLQEEALRLFATHYDFDAQPAVRALTVTASNLCDESEQFQLSLFENERTAERRRRLNRTVDALHERFGSHSVRQAVLLRDTALTGFDPYEKNIIHPVSYLR